MWLSLAAWSTLAPLASSSFTTSCRPYPLLTVRGVMPLSSVWFTVAPLARSTQQATSKTEGVDRQAQRKKRKK